MTDTETVPVLPSGERPAGWGRTAAKYALGLAPFIVVWLVLVGWLALLLSSKAVYTNGVFGVPLATVNGKSYVLEYTDSLPSTNWTALPSAVGDGTVKILLDSAATGRQRFYRVRIELSFAVSDFPFDLLSPGLSMP